MKYEIQRRKYRDCGSFVTMWVIYRVDGIGRFGKVGETLDGLYRTKREAEKALAELNRSY